MSREEYRPTSDEIKKAEESMTPEQVEMSKEKLIELKDKLKDLVKKSRDILEAINDIEDSFRGGNLLMSIGRASQSTDSTNKYWKEKLEQLEAAYDEIEYTLIKPIEDSINQLGEYGK